MCNGLLRPYASQDQNIVAKILCVKLWYICRDKQDVVL